MDELTFGPGTLYFQTLEGIVAKIGTVTEGTFDYVNDEEKNRISSFQKTKEATFTMNADYVDWRGIKVLSILTLWWEKYAKLIHLARRGKNKRIRKKNYLKALELLIKLKEEYY